jgi:hypothetical protein
MCNSALAVQGAAGSAAVLVDADGLASQEVSSFGPGSGLQDLRVGLEVGNTTGLDVIGGAGEKVAEVDLAARGPQAVWVSRREGKAWIR